MRIYLLSKRNAKEILRDPINLFFGLAFPLLLMVLFQIINANIPPEANNTFFSIDTMIPGIMMFGTIFMALFSGMLLAKDRTSSFLMRLFASPLRAGEFIMGYTLPLIVFSLVQGLIALCAAVLMGFELSANLFAAPLAVLPIAILYIGIGLLCGSVMNDKAVGGVCGALLTNLAAWLSGIWFPLELMGDTIKKISQLLPFYHAVEVLRAVFAGRFGAMCGHAAVVFAFALVFYGLAVLAFRRKMAGEST